MRVWFESLNRREQILFSVTALVVALALYFLLIWEPLIIENERLHSDIANRSAQKQWLGKVSAEARWIRRQGRSSQAADTNKSLLAIVDSAGRSSKLSASIKQVQPDGNSVVRVRLEDAPFDKFLHWLERLNNRHGVVAETATLERGESSGHVDGRISLKRALSK